MLLPKRVKHRKQHRGRMRCLAVRGNNLDFGEFALIALEPGWITSRQIEASRIAMTRHVRRVGKVWIRIFPDKPYTKKPLEQRMGKGKAPVEGWVAVVKPGRVMFEMGQGMTEEQAKEAMRLAQFKLPIKTKFVTKRDFEQGPPLEAGQEHILHNMKVKAARKAKHEAKMAAAGTPAPAAVETPAQESTEE